MFGINGSFSNLAHLLNRQKPHLTQNRNQPISFHSGDGVVFNRSATNHNKIGERTQDPRGEGETQGGPGGT